MSLLLLLDSPWIPPRLGPALKLWLDASRISGLSDGDPVSTWSDLSGNGNHATQGTAAKKPTYKVNIVNGKPVVRFDAIDDAMTMAEFFSFHTPTIMIVAKSTTSGIWPAFFEDRGVTSTHDFVIQQEGDTNKVRFFVRDAGADAITVNGGSALSWFAAIVWRDSATSWKQSHNGTVTIGTNASYGDTTWEGTNAPPTLGSSTGGTSLGGDITEFAIWDRALNTAEIDRIEAYCGRKYGISMA